MKHIAEDEIENRLTVPSHERRKRPGITRLVGEHQLLVGSLRTQLNPILSPWLKRVTLRCDLRDLEVTVAAVSRENDRQT